MLQRFNFSLSHLNLLGTNFYHSLNDSQTPRIKVLKKKSGAAKYNDKN